MNKKARNILVGASILFAGLILFSIIKAVLEGEEGRIKRLIYSAKRAIEKERLIKCFSYISFDYEDKYGNDRRTLFLIGKNLLAEYDNISIKISELEVEVSDKDASVEIEAVAYGQRQDLPEKIIEYDRARLKVRLRKEDAGWRVIELEFLEPQDILYLPGVA